MGGRKRIFRKRLRYNRLPFLSGGRNGQATAQIRAAVPAGRLHSGVILHRAVCRVRLVAGRNWFGHGATQNNNDPAHEKQLPT